MVGLMVVSCTTTKHVHHHKVPPGHEKKMYGKKSAKKFAPGQRKKANVHPKKKHDENLFPGANKKKKKHKRHPLD